MDRLVRISESAWANSYTPSPTEDHEYASGLQASMSTRVLCPKVKNAHSVQLAKDMAIGPFGKRLRTINI